VGGAGPGPAHLARRVGATVGPRSPHHAAVAQVDARYGLLQLALRAGAGAGALCGCRGCAAPQPHRPAGCSPARCWQHPARPCSIRAPARCGSWASGTGSRRSRCRRTPPPAQEEGTRPGSGAHRQARLGKSTPGERPDGTSHHLEPLRALRDGWLVGERRQSRPHVRRPAAARAGSAQRGARRPRDVLPADHGLCSSLDAAIGARGIGGGGRGSTGAGCCWGRARGGG
jgi:hypothetical protein